MKNSNPEVITIDPPEEVFNWSNYLIHLDQLAKFRINSDDLVKSEQYKIRANFVRDIGNVKDEFAYLKSINITPTTSALNSSNIGRAAQLCAKTNQYNLRTARHSAQTLLKIAEGHRNICFLVGMSDLYGDHGQVALVCVTEYNDEVAFLDTFLMSCRVLGRHLEAWILKKILNKCRAIGYKQLLGEFISTNRNQPASSFFTDYCFKPVPMGILNEIGANSNKLHFEGQLFVLPTDFSNIPKLDIYEGQD